jgi:hypothetical protein
MSRRIFTNCLNQELKAFNFSIGSIIVGGIFLILFGVSHGVMWGLGAGAIGFRTGEWLSTQWFLGQIQRKMYKHLPGAKIFISSNIPASHQRKLM